MWAIDVKGFDYENKPVDTTFFVTPYADTLKAAIEVANWTVEKDYPGCQIIAANRLQERLGTNQLIQAVERSIEAKKADNWSDEGSGFLWTDIDKVELHEIEANYLKVTIHFTWGEQDFSLDLNEDTCLNLRENEELLKFLVGGDVSGYSI